MDKKFVKYGNYYYLKDNNGTVDSRNAYIRDKDGKIKLYNNSNNPYQLEDVVITPKPKEESRFKQALKMATAYQMGKILDNPVTKTVGYVLDPSRHIGAGMQTLYNYLYPNNNSGLTWRDWYKEPYNHPGVLPGSGANTGTTIITSSLPITIGSNNLNKSAKFINSIVNKYKTFENKVAKKIQPKLIELYLKRNGYSGLYNDLIQNKGPLYFPNNQLQLGSNNQKLLGWATQEVMDKYKDPKMKKALYRRLKSFSESRAFYEMPTEDMSAMELADLSRRLIGRDNRVVRGVQIGTEELETAIKRAKNKTDKETFQRILNRFDERVKENNDPVYNFAIFSKDGITDDEKRILADYFLTRIPDGGHGYRSGQPKNIGLNRDLFDTLYSSNKIGDSYGYVSSYEDSGAMPLIGSVDLRAEELRSISDPMELLERGNLRTKIAKDEYRIEKLKEKGILDSFVSTVKDRKEFDNNYLGIRLKEGKPDIYDRTAYRSIKKYLDKGISDRNKKIYYTDKSGKMIEKTFSEKQRKIYESIDGKNVVTQNSLELKKLIIEYFNVKNDFKKERIIRRIYSLLKKGNFVQRTPGDSNRFFDLNRMFLQEKTSKLKISGVRRHYLTSGRKGQKVGDVHEIYDIDELNKEYRFEPFSRKISNKDGLTTASFPGIGTIGLLNMLNNNDSKKNKK